jgi:hypothetical protein
MLAGCGTAVFLERATSAQGKPRLNAEQKEKRNSHICYGNNVDTGSMLVSSVSPR